MTTISSKLNMARCGSVWNCVMSERTIKHVEDIQGELETDPQFPLQQTWSEGEIPDVSVQFYHIYTTMNLKLL